MSASGSPETATISANFPFSMLPTSCASSKFSSPRHCSSPCGWLGRRHSPFHVIRELKRLHAVADGVGAAAKDFRHSSCSQPPKARFGGTQPGHFSAAGYQVGFLEVANQIPNGLHHRALVPSASGCLNSRIVSSSSPTALVTPTVTCIGISTPAARQLRRPSPP